MPRPKQGHQPKQGRAPNKNCSATTKEPQTSTSNQQQQPTAHNQRPTMTSQRSHRGRSACALTAIHPDVPQRRNQRPEGRLGKGENSIRRLPSLRRQPPVDYRLSLRRRLPSRLPNLRRQLPSRLLSPGGDTTAAGSTISPIITGGTITETITYTVTATSCPSKSTITITATAGASRIEWATRLVAVVDGYHRTVREFESCESGF